jgi:UDPglucose 6-dehydrogenase
MSREPIGVIGVGYVGLVTAACFADLGHTVICRDIDPAKVEMLRAGNVPLHEPGLDDLIRRNRNRLRFTLDLEEMFAETRLAFICVDTPPMPSGDADLSRVQAVIDAIPRSAEGAGLVMKSTVPVGTGEHVRVRLDARDLQAVSYMSNPEFLREGSAVSDFMAPDRVVVGASSDEDAERVARLYDGVDTEIVRTDVASAEMIKLAANAFLATKISFINEIANVCEAVGADVAEVARGMGLDRRIGASFLRPGIGYGGSCFPKDVRALKQLAGNSGYHFQLLTAVIEVNELQKRRVISKLQQYLGPLRDRKIALLGIAFKPNTDDVREASSLVLASRLAAEGAEVRAYDPVASGTHLETVGAIVVSSPAEALAGADAAVIVTEWNEFRAVLDPAMRDSMARPLLIDGRNLLDPAEATAAGFEYDSVGRPRSTSEVASA